MQRTEEAYYHALAELIRPTQAISYPNTLAPMQALLQALGEPQRAYPTVVVGGSIGKGTTAAILAQLLQARGTTVGVYSGPHLHSWRERFAINGHWITPAEFCALQERIRTLLPTSEASYSTFELNTALALAWFAERSVDIAVLEVGIGGRWDAVNAAEQELALLTPIEREHTNLLGGDLRSIALHKAGLIPAGGQAFSAAQAPEVAEILHEEAAARSAQLAFVGGCAAGPKEQARALAEGAFRFLRPKETIPTIDGVAPPGRQEWVERGGRRWLLDGGHTPRAGAHLARILAAEGGASMLLVLAMLRDKQVRAFVSSFSKAPLRYLLTSTPGNRALSPEELRARAQIHAPAVQLEADSVRAIQQAMAAPEEICVVTGSLRLVAIAREQLGLLSSPLVEEAERTRSILAGAWKCSVRRAILPKPSPRSSGERAEVS